MNEFLLLHMLRMYRAFDGDLVECLVLGAIAYENLDRGLAPAEREELVASTGIEKYEAHLRAELPELSPAYAKSIAERTGIPRETVRRKVGALMSKGWVVQDERSGLRLTRAPEGFFRALNEETLREFLEVAAEIGATALDGSLQRGGAELRPENGRTRAARTKGD